MNDWFEALSRMEQLLLAVAVFSTVIFLFQFLMTILGLSSDLDTEADAGLDGASLDFGDIFTIRNGITFLMGFSWGGLMAHEWGLTHPIFIVMVGSLVGTIFVAVGIAILLAFSRIKDSGNINLDNAIGEEGRVTLKVPASRSGVGKVMVTVQGRLKEYHAITDSGELSRNASVVIVDTLGGQLVVGPTS